MDVKGSWTRACRFWEKMSKAVIDYVRSTFCPPCQTLYEIIDRPGTTEAKHTQVYLIITDLVSSLLTRVTSLLHSATPF